ncbi:hypothetical protein FDO65_06675 [Nakamurella flava]|uniref:Uncharacterized protein n=1 Tax=Nakamurella flava TaxID=2576308 RepID=A0A4U6QL62_9ACTN|nr:hypothetical protein [Nakamurella flava]TKV61287.1 hypothetical protein FDO65_06675 [Nakamurella flava]
MTTSDTSRTSSGSGTDHSTSFPSHLSGEGSADDTRTSAWSGSPYEPLPADSTYADYSSSGSTDTAYSPSVYVPPPADAETPTPTGGRRTRARFVAALVGGVAGLLLVAGGLYLIGRFGLQVHDAMVTSRGATDPWDVTLTILGGGLILLATLLNGWTPWATLVPGLVLTGAGVWSLVTYDGADRVATTIDTVFARPEIVLWGVNGWVLGLGAVLLASSGAAIIARAAGRRRGRPGQ